MREQVGQALSREQQLGQRLMALQYNAIDRQIAKTGDPALRRRWNGTSLKTLLG